MTVREALRNYYYDFDHWLNTCAGDVHEVNFHTSGTPYFNNMDEAVAYFHKLGELIANLDWELEKELKNAY